MQFGKKSTLFRVGDLFAILLVLLLVGALLWAFFSWERGAAAQITVEGEGVAVLPLSQDAVYPITSRGYCLTVHVESGEVFVSDADCPDKVCIKSGELDKNGDFASCLPEKVVVKVSGERESDSPDAIVY